jgi:hypothetical protein
VRAVAVTSPRRQTTKDVCLIFICAQISTSAQSSSARRPAFDVSRSSFELVNPQAALFLLLAALILRNKRLLLALVARAVCAVC